MPLEEVENPYFKTPYVDIPVSESNPACHFQYTYPFAFNTIAAAWLNKYNYEPKVTLTTIGRVE